MCNVIRPERCWLGCCQGDKQRNKKQTKNICLVLINERFINLEKVMVEDAAK